MAAGVHTPSYSNAWVSDVTSALPSGGELIGKLLVLGSAVSVGTMASSSPPPGLGGPLCRVQFRIEH